MLPSRPAISSRRPDRPVGAGLRTVDMRAASVQRDAPGVRRQPGLEVLQLRVQRPRPRDVRTAASAGGGDRLGAGQRRGGDRKRAFHGGPSRHCREWEMVNGRWEMGFILPFPLSPFPFPISEGTPSS